MLGFREISQLTDGLEDIVEAINKEEIENTVELQTNIGLAVETIKKLSAGDKVPTSSLAGIITKLDISEKRIEAAPPKKEADRKVITDVFFTESDELLEKLNNDFLEIEKMPESSTLIADILRNLHTCLFDILILS